MTIDPSLDGFTHINAYSKSRTEVGRALSNFAHTPFRVEDGTFHSVEGYWYWLLTPPEKIAVRGSLQRRTGFAAKKLGRANMVQDWPSHDDHVFRNKIILALQAKVKTNPRVGILLVETGTLPIVHYYSYGTPPVVRVPSRGLWIWKEWERIRALLIEGGFESLPYPPASRGY